MPVTLTSAAPEKKDTWAVAKRLRGLFLRSFDLLPVPMGFLQLPRLPLAVQKHAAFCPKE